RIETWRPDVVSERAVIAEYVRKHLRPIDCQAQRLSHPHVVERRLSHVHEEGIAAAAVAGEGYCSLGLQRCQRRERAVACEVRLVRGHRVDLRRLALIVDYDDLIDVRFSRLPIVGVALEGALPAR